MNRIIQVRLLELMFLLALQFSFNRQHYNTGANDTFTLSYFSTLSPLLTPADSITVTLYGVSPLRRLSMGHLHACSFILDEALVQLPQKEI
jgi:hypothetical protein